MVRTWKKKDRQGSYTEHDMQKAIAEVKSPLSGSILQVAKKYQIPYETLRGRCAKNQTMLRKRGHLPAIPFLEERDVALTLIFSAEGGRPINRAGLQQIVKDYLDFQGRIVDTFTNNTPGKDWVSIS